MFECVVVFIDYLHTKSHKQSLILILSHIHSPFDQSMFECVVVFIDYLQYIPNLTNNLSSSPYLTSTALLINLCSSVLWFSYGLLAINAINVWLPNLIGMVIICFELLLCMLFPPTHHMERTAKEEKIVALGAAMQEAQAITATIVNSTKSERQNDRIFNDNVMDYSSTTIKGEEDFDNDIYIFKKPSMIFASFQSSRQLLPGMRDLHGFIPNSVGISPPPSPSKNQYTRPTQYLRQLQTEAMND